MLTLEITFDHDCKYLNQNLKFSNPNFFIWSIRTKVKNLNSELTLYQREI